MVKKIEINLSNKTFYTFIAVGAIVLLGMIVTAYNIGMNGGNPNIVGHSSDEINVDVGGNVKSLQQAINDGDFAGGSGGGDEVGTVENGKLCVGDSAGLVQCNSQLFIGEVAGNNNYFSSGKLGGDQITTQVTSSWTTSAKIEFKMAGTYRFYWAYRNNVNNCHGTWRVLKNGVVVSGPYNQDGYGGSPNVWHYITNDISVIPADTIQFQVMSSNCRTGLDTLIWMRGEHLTGVFDATSCGCGTHDCWSTWVVTHSSCSGTDYTYLCTPGGSVQIGSAYVNNCN